MCFKAVGKVIAYSKAKSSQRLVLLVLAHHLNPNTGLCNPSMKTLAAECNLSSRQVYTVIKRLVDLGELRIRSGATNSQSNSYQLCLKAKADAHLMGAAPAANTPQADSAPSLKPSSQGTEVYFHIKKEKGQQRHKKSRKWTTEMFEL